MLEKHAQRLKACDGQTPAYRLCSGTPGKLARAARDARMHGLSTLTRGTEHILPRPSDPAGFPTKKTAPDQRMVRGGWGRMLEGGGAQRAAIGRAPLGAKRMHRGTLAFRNGYFSFGVSFTFCPRLATTGMVMAGHASTQALQRVQSASVRSP